MTTPHPYSVSTFMLLDASVLDDMVAALDGVWTPAAEADEVRRARLVCAARLRLYGPIDRSGWYLCTTRLIHDMTSKEGHAAWVVDLVATIDSYDDAPAGEDVDSLMKEYVANQDLHPSAADVLAHAVLYEPIKYIVTNEVRAYKHARDHDLPSRLEIITPADAVEMLGLAPGEEPPSEPPPDWPEPDDQAWWIP